MAHPLPAAPSTERESSRVDWLAVAAIVGLLYFAREFLVPIVLAGLLSFVLDPLNRRLERLGVRHVFAVLTTTFFSFVLLGVLIYIFTTQALEVAQKLPDYRANLIEKANSIRKSSEGPLGRAVQTLKDVVSSIEKPESRVPLAPGLPPPVTARPMPVEVVPSTSDTMASASGYLGPILGPLGSAAVVALISVFMMLGRDDLRDRIVYLVGRGRLRLTTHALDEAGKRVSRYLLAQFIVNLTYGIPIGIGLYFIGIPNAILWGMLTIVLRFLPYIGPWLAASFPVILSIAVSNSWTMFALTIGLFVVVELISNNVIEPWLYGAKTGLSPLAVVVSAVFWTWLWGIAGLVLATPLTVCLVVIGKHVPQFRWLDLLMGDRPPITTGDRIYHRLLAGDEEEASELVTQEAERSESTVVAFDRVALPAARLIESDFGDGLLKDGKRTDALLHLREIIAEQGDARAIPQGAKPTVLCIPARTLGDEICAEMLMAGLSVHGVTVECLSSGLTTGESVADAKRLDPSIICISVLCASSVIAAAFLCKNLRTLLPEARIVVGLWQEESDEFSRRASRLEKVGAHRVLPSLERAVAAVLEIVPPDQLVVAERSVASEETKPEAA